MGRSPGSISSSGGDNEDDDDEKEDEEMDDKEGDVLRKASDLLCLPDSVSK